MKVVVIEDNKYWNNKIVSIIKNILERENTILEIISSNEYDSQIEKSIFDNEIKIYIIDMNLNYLNGYEIANIIRYDKKDWQSIIIMVSVDNYKEEIITSCLSILTYISKDTNFNEELSNSILVALNIISNKKQIKIKEGSSLYKIFLPDILYIEKEKNSKYSIIVTKRRNYRTRTSLKELKALTGFSQVKKHLLINNDNKSDEDYI